MSANGTSTSRLSLALAQKTRSSQKTTKVDFCRARLKLISPSVPLAIRFRLISKLFRSTAGSLIAKSVSGLASPPERNLLRSSKIIREVDILTLWKSSTFGGTKLKRYGYITLQTGILNAIARHSIPLLVPQVR